MARSGLAADGGLLDHLDLRRCSSTRNVSGATDHRASHVLYSAAAQYALAGRNDDALTTLERAFALGHPDRDGAARDPDLAALRSDPRLKKLTAAR